MKKMNEKKKFIKAGISKYLILLAVVLLGNFSLRAQTLTRFQTDSLSGDTSLQTSTEQLFGQPAMVGSGNIQVFYNFSKLKKSILLTLIIQTEKTTPFSVIPDSTTTVTFKDTTAVELHCNQSVSSVFRGAGHSIVAYFSVTPDILASFLTESVSKFAIGFDGGNIEIELTDENSDKFKRSVGLLSSSFPGD